MTLQWMRARPTLPPTDISKYVSSLSETILWRKDLAIMRRNEQYPSVDESSHGASIGEGRGAVRGSEEEDYRQSCHTCAKTIF